MSWASWLLLAAWAVWAVWMMITAPLHVRKLEQERRRDLVTAALLMGWPERDPDTIMARIDAALRNNRL